MARQMENLLITLHVADATTIAPWHVRTALRRQAGIVVADAAVLLAKTPLVVTASNDNSLHECFIMVGLCASAAVVT